MDLPPLPSVAIVQPSTNHYHLTFTWDTVTNAQWYALIVRKDGVEQFRRYSMTNWVTVSNLDGNLPYDFFMIATNKLDMVPWNPTTKKLETTSDEVRVPTRLVVVKDGPRSLALEPTNQYQFFTNLHPVAISNYNAASQLRKD